MEASQTRIISTPLATLPSKQGLKRSHVVIDTTHIATLPLATLPSKQGLKRQLPTEDNNIRGPLATLPSKQGLKPNSDDREAYYLDPLATLPSKQGLKRASRMDGMLSTVPLSLHFHQNKD